jgi:hypothetical protein
MIYWKSPGHASARHVNKNGCLGCLHPLLNALDLGDHASIGNRTIYSSLDLALPPRVSTTAVLITWVSILLSQPLSLGMDIGVGPLGIVASRSCPIPRSRQTEQVRPYPPKTRVLIDGSDDATMVLKWSRTNALWVARSLERAVELKGSMISPVAMDILVLETRLPMANGLSGGSDPSADLLALN